MSGPLKEPFEIKVYEIDDVERLQRRRQEDSAEVSEGSCLLSVIQAPHTVTPLILESLGLSSSLHTVHAA